MLSEHLSLEALELDRSTLRDLGFEIVGCASGSIDVLLAVRETKAQVVILLSCDDTEPGLVSHLLAEYPDLVVLTVLPDKRFSLTQQCQISYLTDNPSLRMLFDRIRVAVNNPPKVTVGWTTTSF